MKIISINGMGRFSKMIAESNTSVFESRTNTKLPSVVIDNVEITQFIKCLYPHKYNNYLKRGQNDIFR